MLDVIVVGGGPAGIAAALTAAKAGARTALLEKEKRIGRRLAVTGNGRGNVGNLLVTIAHYNKNAATLLSTLPGALNSAALSTLLKSFGILTTADEAGRLYPVSRQAGNMVWALQDLLTEYEVDIQVNTRVKDITVKCDAGEHFSFQLETEKGTRSARALVLAVGGMAQPALGGCDAYRTLLASYKPDVIEPSPALVPLQTEMTLAQAEGVRVAAAGTLVNRYGDILAQSDGEYLFTKTGVSGIAAMRLARAVNRSEGPTLLQLDLLPAHHADALLIWLKQITLLQPARDARYILDSLLPQKLAVPLAAPVVGKRVNRDLTDTDRTRLVSLLKKTKLPVTGTGSWPQAQVMSGGIAVSEVHSENLQLNRQPGLFLAGEMLDVDGDTGGYNLHWAFLSGQAAGEGAATFSKK